MTNYLTALRRTSSKARVLYHRIQDQDYRVSEALRSIDEMIVWLQEAKKDILSKTQWGVESNE